MTVGLSKTGDLERGIRIDRRVASNLRRLKQRVKKMGRIVVLGSCFLVACSSPCGYLYTYSKFTPQSITTSPDVHDPDIGLSQGNLATNLSVTHQVVWWFGGKLITVGDLSTRIGDSQTFDIRDLDVILQDRPLTVTDSSSGSALQIATLRPTDSRKAGRPDPDRFEGWSFTEDAILWRDDSWHISHFSSAFERTDETLPSESPTFAFYEQYKWQQGYADLLHALSVGIWGAPKFADFTLRGRPAGTLRMTDDHQVFYNDGILDHILGSGNPDVAGGIPVPIVYASGDGNQLLFHYTSDSPRGLLVDMAKLTASDAELASVPFVESPTVKTTSFDGRFTATVGNATQLWNGTITMTVIGRRKADRDLAAHCPRFDGRDAEVDYDVALHISQGTGFIDMNGTATFTLQSAPAGG
jgi:hypothetical protein